MVILGEGFGKAVEEGLHRRRIGIGHHQRKRVVGAWLHGREDIGEGEALIAKPRRTLAALPPDMADAPLLADARLVLEEQAKTLVLMPYTDGLQERRSPFLKASAWAGSFCGWLGLAFCLEKPRRFKSRPSEAG